MGKKRGPYSSKRQLDRRLRILRATGEQLEKHGASALTMQAIADISEVAPKTLYNLFGSRDQLLLEAASERLVDLEQSDYVLAAEAGLCRLLAYAVGSMRQFMEMPTYAKTVISLLAASDLSPEDAFLRFGVVQRFAHTSLEIAATRGELRPGINLYEFANQIATNQWGAVLWWEKGLLSLDQLETHVRLSHYTTLIPICRGNRLAQMKTELEELLTAQFSGEPSQKNNTEQSRVFDINPRR